MRPLPARHFRGIVQLLALLVPAVHKGSQPAREQASGSVKGRGALQFLSFTRSQFFEAYGPDRKGGKSWEAIRRGEDKPHESTGLEVICGPIFVDGVEDFLRPQSGLRIPRDTGGSPAEEGPASSPALCRLARDVESPGGLYRQLQAAGEPLTTEEADLHPAVKDIQQTYLADGHKRR
jgi:hypothetical protein